MTQNLVYAFLVEYCFILFIYSWIEMMMFGGFILYQYPTKSSLLPVVCMFSRYQVYRNIYDCRKRITMHIPRLMFSNY